LNTIVAKAKTIGDTAHRTPHTAHRTPHTAQRAADGAAFPKNGDFEAGASGDGWSPLAAYGAPGFYPQTDNAHAYSGAWHLTHNANGGAYQDCASAYFPAAPGDTVQASCMMRNFQGGANGNVYFRIWQYDAAGAYIAEVAGMGLGSTTPISGSEWRRGTISAKLTDARAAFCRVGFAVDGRTTGFMLFDQVRATVSKPTAATASNLQANANFGGINGNLAPWSVTGNTHGVPYTLNARRGSVAGPTWWPGGNLGVIELRQTDASSAGGYIDVSSNVRIPVKPSTRYQFWVMLAAHRCDCSTYLIVRNRAGDVLAYPAGNLIVSGAAEGGAESGYKHSGGFYLTDPNADTVELVIRKSNTSSGTDSWLWGIKAFVGPAAEQQVEYSLWSEPAPYSADGISNGDFFGVMSNEDLWDPRGARRNGMRIPGSGHRFGDERNMRALAGWNRTNGAASLSLTSSDAGSTATISVPAHSRFAGFGTTSFASASITGLAFSTYYLIYRDTPNYDAAEGAYAASTDSYAGVKHSDRVVIGGITTVADGGTSSGGVGFGDCVHADAWVRPGVRARDVRRFTLLDVLRPQRWRWRLLWRLLGRRLPARWTPRLSMQPGVLIETEGGAQLPCSHSTPFDLPRGRVAYAPYLRGEFVHTDAGVERVVRVTDLGQILVARISVYGHSFAAGRHPARRIFSHNATSKP
jgi:hypothetical protein